MVQPLKRTLGQIRSDIQIRLGFGMAGQAGIVNSPLIDSFIQSAQEQLYEQFDWIELKRVLERDLGFEQQYIDYPDDCNVERIKSIHLIWNERYTPMVEGIENQYRNLHPTGIPTRYERREQIELWPLPDTSDYKLHIEYIKTLDPLVDSSDRVSLPSEMVFLHALSNAKNHYDQKDKGVYAAQLEALMNRLKAGNRKTVYQSTKTIDPYSYVSADQQV